MSEIAYRTGDADLAARRAEEALARFRASGHSSGAAMAFTILARLAAERGDDRRALTHYQEGLRLWAGIGERWAIVRALAGAAAIAAAQGQPEQAATLVGAVNARLEEGGAQIFPSDRQLHDQAAVTARAALGAERFADLHAVGRALPIREVVAVAAAIEVPTAPAGHPRRAPNADALTPRERDVLRLLAEGSTDQAIADALFVGRRTASTHVSNILAKLGVASRRDAVARARERGWLAPDDRPPPYT